MNLDIPLLMAMETKAKARLIPLQGNPDFELAHAEGDKILCDLLIELGFVGVVQQYLKITRHCA